MKIAKQISIILLLLWLLSCHIQAQSFDHARMDSFFNLLAAENKAMGSIAFSKNGKVIYSKAIGYSYINGSEKTPSTPATSYRIGSITKTFTATMIFQLIEAGKLKLTTTLDTYFPDLPNAKLITISQLLSHRSGLHNFTDDPVYMTWMTQPKTHEELLSIIGKYPADFQPDEKFHYSNSNYLILGYILEKIYNKPYKDIMEEKICKVLGLHDTYYGGKTDHRNNESSSYKYAFLWQEEPETDLSISAGAGAIVSTSADLCRFMDALFSLKLISAASLAQMRTIRSGYGMGMMQAPFYTRISYGHTGGIDGFLSRAFYFPDDSVAIAYCSNGTVFPINDILIGALSIFFDKPYEFPSFRIYELKPADLDKYLGVYSSPGMPLQITITRDSAVLLAQATGQASFRLDATAADKFKFDPTGIMMEFKPDKNEMKFSQGGVTYLFTKLK